jgi:hypothetical protein
MRLWLFCKKMDTPHSWEKHLVAGVTEYDAVLYMSILGGYTEDRVREKFEIEELPLVGIVYSDIC